MKVEVVIHDTEKCERRAVSIKLTPKQIAELGIGEDEVVVYVGLKPDTI